MILRDEFEEDQSRKSSILKKGATVALVAYLSICMPNTVRTIKEMGPVSVEFEKIVYDGPNKVNKGIVGSLDYGGRLDEVINKRNAILDKNNCGMMPYFGKWTAEASWVKGEYKYSASSPRALFCYPLNKSRVKK